MDEQKTTIASASGVNIGDAAKAAVFLSKHFDVKNIDETHEIFAALTKSLKSASSKNAATT